MPVAHRDKVKRTAWIATTETIRSNSAFVRNSRQRKAAPWSEPDGMAPLKTKKGNQMLRFKTYMAAASAMACLVAPASAGGPEGMNGKSLNGLQYNSLTSNSLTSNAITTNAIFANGLGVYALNGVHADGIVLAKSLAPAGGSIVDPNDRNLPAVQHGSGSFLNPNMGNLPAVQKGQPSTAGKKSNGLPSGHSVGGGDGSNHDRPTPSPRR
ncbi:hypothetical protein NKI36_17005 [Mesorhizobium caraganae]|uniref:Uncharacterized protein n=1 Tax=Mesorhizobium caraganae TaxID=483206 RepID=A0ABV1Z157_9HYPH